MFLVLQPVIVDAEVAFFERTTPVDVIEEDYVPIKRFTWLVTSGRDYMHIYKPQHMIRTIIK